MKHRQFYLRATIVCTLIAALAGISLIVTSTNTSAQEQQGRQKGNGDRPQADNTQKEIIIADPLPKDDPRAQLDPQLVSAQPMIEPAYAIEGGGDDNPLAAAAASIDLKTSVMVLDTQINQMEEQPALSRTGNDEPYLSPGSVGSGKEDAGDYETATPDSVLRSKDRRRRLTPTTEYPRRAMTKLFVTFPSGARYVCSGAMINAKYVLTAGHCIYAHTEGGIAIHIEVVPALDGFYKPFGSAYGVFARTYQGWVTNKDTKFDIGLITLDRRIGLVTGWFGYGYFPKVTGSLAHLGGYPVMYGSGTHLLYDNGKVLKTTTSRVSYDIDTSPGQSGGGVYLKYQGMRYVFAAHSSGGTTDNSGTRITARMFFDIKDWIDSGT